MTFKKRLEEKSKIEKMIHLLSVDLEDGLSNQEGIVIGTIVNVNEYLVDTLSHKDYQDQRRQINNENVGIQEQEQQLQKLLDRDTSLQSKRITGLDLLADCVKVKKLTQKLVKSLIENVVIKNGKAVKVRLKVWVRNKVSPNVLLNDSSSDAPNDAPRITII